jgi:hypothetical protein
VNETETFKKGKSPGHCPGFFGSVVNKTYIFDGVPPEMRE